MSGLERTARERPDPWAGAGQIVLLSGEAGIGKSRLAAEVANEPHTRLHYHCSPYRCDSVLHPSVVQLGRAARLDPGTRRRALSRIAETAPLFASLLSIPTGGRYPVEKGVQPFGALFSSVALSFSAKLLASKT